jgi:hypothetical protein
MPAGQGGDAAVIQRSSMYRRLAALLVLCLGTACSSLLPKSKEVTASPWQTYQDAQETFDKIIPGRTTIADLRTMSLDPGANANIAILNYADVMRKFLLNQSFSINDLDNGVRECVMAKIACKGFEINQSSVQRQRMGNVIVDVLGFYRETHTAGWRFNGLILLRDDIVVYKLTGGQPVIQQTEENQNPLGPVQAISSKVTGISF